MPEKSPAVFVASLGEEGFVVGVWIRHDNGGDELPQVIAEAETALHKITDAIEKAGVVRRDDPVICSRRDS